MTLDLDRIRSRAEAASGHPTWSVAYAEDVPALLAEVERLRGHIEAIAAEGVRMLKAADADIFALQCRLSEARDESEIRLVQMQKRVDDAEAHRDRWRTIADDMAQVLRDLAETQGLLPSYSTTEPGTGPVGVHNAVRHICHGALIDYEAAKAGEAK